MSLPIIVLGGGEHAKVLINALLLFKAPVIGFTSPLSDNQPEMICGVKRLGTDEIITEYKPSEVLLVNGIGSIGRPAIRKSIFYSYSKRGYNFTNVIHPSVVLPEDVEITNGIQMMAGVVVQPGCHFGENTIVNTRAIVDHDCLIGKNVHISPGAVICGNVSIEDNVHIGAGATIIQGITIGENSIVGAGSVVIRNIPQNVTVIGVPAKEVKP